MDSPACEEVAEYVREIPALNSVWCSKEMKLEFEKIAALALLEWPLSRLRFVVRGESPNTYAIVVAVGIVISIVMCTSIVVF